MVMVIGVIIEVVTEVVVAITTIIILIIGIIINVIMIVLILIIIIYVRILFVTVFRCHHMILVQLNEKDYYLGCFTKFKSMLSIGHAMYKTL